MARVSYGFDPLCGWCFGFIPAVRRLRVECPELPIELVMGGLVTGERVGPYGAMAGYIRQASARMEAVTGQALGAPSFRLLERGDVLSASAPPTWVLTLRAQGPRRAGPASQLMSVPRGAQSVVYETTRSFERATSKKS